VNIFSPVREDWVRGDARICGGKLLSYLHGGDNMIRTQVSLDERDYAAGKKEAEALGISVAELVRRAIRQALPPAGNAPWMRFAGFVESGDALSSQSIDEILYSAKE
jgi:hypothetical protein